jgi:hypothetical protein
VGLVDRECGRPCAGAPHALSQRHVVPRTITPDRLTSDAAAKAGVPKCTDVPQRLRYPDDGQEWRPSSAPVVRKRAASTQRRVVVHI